MDDTLQPYRLFIPESYNASKPTPLVVALHGMGGDENSMFDSYGNGLLKREAERARFLVAARRAATRLPCTVAGGKGCARRDGGGPQRTYRVDSSRIYLMGHSMGAYGTGASPWITPISLPRSAPISGGGNPAGMVKIRHIPQYVVHGDDDRTVAVSQSRNMVEAGKKAGAEIVYVEVPGGSHTSVAAPAFAAMLDFFARQQKGGRAKIGRPSLRGHGGFPGVRIRYVGGIGEAHPLLDLSVSYRKQMRDGRIDLSARIAHRGPVAASHHHRITLRDELFGHHDASRSGVRDGLEELEVSGPRATLRRGRWPDHS